MASRRTGAVWTVLRFVRGDAMDGTLHTNATFLQAPTKVLHPKGRVSSWHWRPGWHRGAIRTAVLALVPVIAAGLIRETAPTVAVLAAIPAGLVLWCAWRAACHARAWARACTWDSGHPWKSAGAAVALPWHHLVYFRRPLKIALTEEFDGHQPKLRLPLDRSEAVVHPPYQWTGGDKKMESVTRIVTTKLALEAPDVAAKLHGRRPRIKFTLSDPPPSLVTWGDVAAHVMAAKQAELISGVGKRGQITKVSLELDSPHFGIISGTGGGKSNLAAFWLIQELMRGSVALILDAKRFSHAWTYKDMDAEYGLLPNVAYCRTVSDLHDGMCWLGAELDRRNAVVERGINAKGDVKGDVGPRVWIIAEEMNLARGALKAHWAAIRDPDDPKKSPAFTGLGAVSYAGRAVRMHLVVIGQMLTAEVLGGGDVRENIGVRMLTRYTQNSWKMQAGDIPMPPPPTTPGRWQQLVSGAVSETQVPYIDMEQARELAVSGIVTPALAGMPGRGIAAADVLVPPMAERDSAPDLPVVPGLTIREAIDEGIFGPVSLDAARKRVQRARLEPAGRRGDGSNTYERAALFAAARKELTS